MKSFFPPRSLLPLGQTPLFHSRRAAASVRMSTPCKHLWHTRSNATGELTKHSWVFPHKGPTTHLPDGTDPSPTLRAWLTQHPIFKSSWKIHARYSPFIYMDETPAKKAAVALIPSVCFFSLAVGFGNSGVWFRACALIATPRLFECFETLAPRGRIRGVRVEVRIKQMGRLGGWGGGEGGIRMEAVSLCQNWGRPSPGGGGGGGAGGGSSRKGKNLELHTHRESDGSHNVPLSPGLWPAHGIGQVCRQCLPSHPSAVHLLHRNRNFCLKHTLVKPHPLTPLDLIYFPPTPHQPT